MDDDDRDRLEELALKRAQHEEFERERAKLEHRWQETLDAFTSEHGKIIHEYWSTSRPGGVAVTVKSLYRTWPLRRVRRGQVQFHRFTDYLTPQYPEADELLFAGDALAAICEEVLRGPTQRIALTQVYMAASQLVSSLDAVLSQRRSSYSVADEGGQPYDDEPYELYEPYESGDGEDPEERRKRLEERRKAREAREEERRRARDEEREKQKTERDQRLLRAASGYRTSLSRAERFYRDGAEQSAQFYYFMGMLIGAAVVSASVLVVTLLLPYLTDLWGLDLSKKDTAAAFAAAVAGALGACVSVMWRMTAGTFREDAVFGADNLKRLGGFRPFLGSMFGLILYVALQAGMISTTYIPDNPGWYFYIFLAFLAGFSERLVPDFLGDSGKGVSPREAAAQAEQDSVLTQSDEDHSPIITA